MVPESTCFLLQTLAEDQNLTENPEKSVEATTTPDLLASEHEVSERAEADYYFFSEKCRESIKEPSSRLMAETQSEESRLSTFLESESSVGSPTTIRLSTSGVVPTETGLSSVPVHELLDTRRSTVLTARDSACWDVGISPDRGELRNSFVAQQLNLGNRPQELSDTQGLPAPHRSEPEPTTLMIRNIHNEYTSVGLLTELTQAGLLRPGDFDFFYLPLDFRSNASVGYGFLNLTSMEVLRRFTKAFNRYRMKHGCKKGVINEARVQGLDANIEHYRNNPVMLIDDENAKPMMFKGKQRVRFPEPTVEIRPVILKLKYRNHDSRNSQENGQTSRKQGRGRQAYRRAMEAADKW